MSKRITVQDGDLTFDVTTGNIVANVPLFIEEQNTPNADVTDHGQLWVRDDAPNTLVFTDDDGTDFVLNAADVVSSLGTPVNNQVAIWTDASTVEGDANLTYNSALQQLLVPSINDAATPAIGIGFTNQGFYAVSSSIIGVVVGGSLRARFSTGSFDSNLPNGFAILTQVNASATQPVFSFSGDANTGIGRADTDELSLIAGGIEIVRMVHTGLTDHMRVLGPIFVEEAPSEEADISGFGQIWVRNDDPNTLMFTDDLGNDVVVGLTGSSPIADGATTSSVLRWSGSAWIEEASVTIDTAGRITVPQLDEVATPTLAFGDGDTGFYESTNDVLNVSIGGVQTAQFNAAWVIQDPTAGGPGLLNEVPTSTNPTVIPGTGDTDTGIGGAGGDVLSVIAGGVEAVRYSEATGVLVAVQSDVGLTANAGSAQGNGVILSTYNVYSTVGTIGDAATLPATFPVGTKIYVKNDGANSMDVFPASGDDAGAGLNTAVAVDVGTSVTFIATTTDATWTELIVGGAGSNGDVTKVGTPVNNEIGVWTGDGTLEGDTNLQWTGTNLALTGTTHLVLPQTNDAATPTLAFGDGDTGFFEIASNIIRITLSGSSRFQWTDNEYQGTANNSASMLATSGNATTPVFRFNGDPDTGIGRSGANELSLIAGGMEAVRYCETTGVIVTVQSDVGLTANVGSAQGNGVILSTYNVYSTVGTTGDAATLPTTFPVGTKIYVKNDGANSMDVFPASGDDAGAGANIAVAVAAGTSAIFIAITTDTTWTQLIEVAAGGAPDQNLWLTVDGDTGSTAANITTDTLTIAGGTGITTAMSGDTLTVTQDTITLGTNTTGNYVATIVGGTGIDSTGATTGEGIAHTLSFDASELGVSTMVTGDWIVFDNAGVSNKALISAIPLSIFNNDLSISTTLDGLSDTNITSVANGHLLMWDSTPGEWVNATLLPFTYTFSNAVTFSGNVTGNAINATGGDVHLSDNRAIGFGEGVAGIGDIRAFWDGTDLEIVSLSSDRTINFRDGVHLRIWDSTDTDWLNLHNDGTNFVLTESGLTQITFPAAGTLALDMNDNIIDTARLKDYSIESDAPTVSGTAVTLTYSSGPAFQIDLEPSSGNVVITITGGPPSGTHGQITVKVQQDGASSRTVSFTSGTFRHAGGTIHTMNPTVNGFSIYTLETWDSGTIWYVGGADYS